MTRKNKRQNQPEQNAGFLWKCPFCTRKVRFPKGSKDYSAISAVHHFHERHHINQEGILKYAPNLKHAANEYFGPAPETAVDRAPEPQAVFS